MDRKQLIEARVERDGYSVAEFYEHADNGLTGKVGRFTVTAPDAEDEGIFEGDEGVLEAIVVGAEQYGNVRVTYVFTADQTDGGNEVNNLSILDPIDD